MARRNQSDIDGLNQPAHDAGSLKPSDSGGTMTAADNKSVAKARRALALAAIRVAEQGSAQQPDS